MSDKPKITIDIPGFIGWLQERSENPLDFYRWHMTKTLGINETTYSFSQEITQMWSVINIRSRSIEPRTWGEFHAPGNVISVSFRGPYSPNVIGKLHHLNLDSEEYDLSPLDQVVYGIAESKHNRYSSRPRSASERYQAFCGLDFVREKK